ncbi:hypothetical protein M3A49_39140 [Paraburkholderia sp. CNPSo 3076]|uniref:hypothetical protein n=1 Tax=Paraburkholderia sp. CNPSo 3076 TaxID=2940936 RepID=UPI002257D30F|nr:hypothetical protein [Paraburkholderia sp. CNPSo 3076]MCX5545380.1 hypothetical protein [Paraburkholderia sp. CNPSo 3076]
MQRPVTVSVPQRTCREDGSVPDTGGSFIGGPMSAPGSRDFLPAFWTVDTEGKRIEDEAENRRIEALAIPPAKSAAVPGV